DGARIVVDIEEGYARATPTGLGVYHAYIVDEDGNKQRAEGFDFAVNAPVEEGAYAAVDPAQIKAWEKAAQTNVMAGELDDASAQRNRLWPTLLLCALM